jgi:hypothetical protein
MISSAINSVLYRWANLHPIVRLLLLLVAAVMAVLVGVKPAYGAFKNWRMSQNLKAARDALHEARMMDARDHSLSVLRSGNPCIEAIRILEKSSAALLDPCHGEIARALIAHSEATVEDRLTGFLGIVMEVPLGLVGQAWNLLGTETQADSRAAEGFARRLIAERRFGEAISVLRAIPGRQRDGPVQRALARALIGTGRWEAGEEAQQVISDGFPDGGPELPAWLDLLEEVPPLPLEDRMLDPIRGRLCHLAAEGDARCALMIARMDYATLLTRREEIVAGAVVKWKNAGPEALARFLNAVGRFRILLQFLPDERIEEHPNLLPHLLEAAERSGDWDRATEMLRCHGQKLSKRDELAHHAVIAAKTNDANARMEAWNAAMAEAARSPGDNGFLALERVAVAAEMAVEAEVAKVAAIRAGLGPLPLFEDLGPLLNSLELQGREHTIMEICAIYLTFEPGNPSLLTRYAFLACMSGVVEPKMVIKAIAPLTARYPDEFPILAVLATAHLCDGQPSRAAEILDSVNLVPTELAPAYRAVYLTAQVLNSRISPHDPQITGFPWQSLLPAQRKKFSELIRSAKQ